MGDGADAAHGVSAAPPAARGRAFRVGVIGTGFAARNAHLPGWADVSGVELAALCDPDPAALAAASRLAPAARVFADHRDVLALGLDAVSIAAHNAAHFPIARDALRAGIHVLCEKPLCVSPAEVRALGMEADARGLVLMARHQLRFGERARAVRAQVRAGHLGALHHARVRAIRRDRIPTVPGLIDIALAGGGAAIDLGVHVLDMALWLLDFPRALRVTGSVRTDFGHLEDGKKGITGRWGAWDHARFSVEDSASGLIHLENGATLALECAWAGHHEREGLDVTLFGDKASLYWSAEERVPSHPDFAAFLEACRGGGASPVPWREALGSVEIIDALYRSAREGREAGIGE